MNYVYPITSSDAPGKPTISTNIASPNQGDSVTLTCTSTSTATITSYSWQLSGSDLSGETSSVLTLTNIQPAQAGDYTCVAKVGQVASDSSDAFTVTVFRKLHNHLLI